MQVITQSPQLKIREELNQLIEKKVDHLQRINNRITKCEILLKKENSDSENPFCVEIHLKVSRKTLFARETAENFEIALHKVINDLESQLRRIKVARGRIS